jgi:hypothetical protein
MLLEETIPTSVLNFDLVKQDARLFDAAYFLLRQLLGQKDFAVLKGKWLTSSGSLPSKLEFQFI